MYFQQSFPVNVTAMITHYGLNDPKAFITDLEWILSSWNRAYFKRVQMPPNIIISKGAFGYDYRESQMTYEKTTQYQDLVQQILAS
jgi:NAD+ synthase (glutamine-hydrolysing)